MIRRSSILLLALFTFGGLTAGLLFSEGALRFQERMTLDGEQAKVGPGILYQMVDGPPVYELSPNVQDFQGKIRTDSHGLRGGELPIENDQYRILFSGDSVTFAGELPESEIFTSRAAELLKASNEPRLKNVAALNAGVPGYSPWNQLHWLKKHSAALRPDLIVVQFCPNDIWHLNADGHEVTAVALAREILERESASEGPTPWVR